MISLPLLRTFGRLVPAILLVGMAGLRPVRAQEAPAQTPPAEDSSKQAKPPAEAAVSTSRGTAAEPAADEPAILLDPYTVSTDTRGYYGANTMSGTRMNTRIEDLASSITVVTKEQMNDFAMLDINDIFAYTANTEGTQTYTDITVDRNGQITDNSQGNPNNANRVRGLSAANISYGNFEMSGRTPIDPLIIDGVEVSRGPNASVFGLGNPSGTVNQIPIQANVSRSRYTTSFRADSYGGWRTTFDINQMLKKDKLAIRVNGGRQHEDWERKPTGFETKRLDTMVKFRPFERTTFTASYLYYYGYGNRPNNTTPRDYVSAWLAAGKPGWDPVSNLITLNGVVYGANTADDKPGVAANTYIADVSTHKTGPITDAMFSLPQSIGNESDAVANARRIFSRSGGQVTRSNLFVDQSGVTYWTAPTGTLTTPAGGSSTTTRLVVPDASAIFVSTTPGRYDSQPLFTSTPGVADKSLYDWTKINLSSIDIFADRTDTYMAQLDQTFIQTPRQNLTAMAAFFREDAERYRRTPASSSGNSGQSGQLYVDVNTRNLDGTVNTNFGRPYISVIEPRTTLQPLRNDTYRAEAAYRLDLSREKGWLKWLGTQTFSAYYDYKYRISRQYSFRDVMTSNTSWINAALNSGVARGNQQTNSLPGVPQPGPNIMRIAYRYYVGDANGSNVDYAPTEFKYGSYPFVWGSAGAWHYDPIQIGQVATTDASSYTANNKQIIKTPGMMLQSHLFEDRLVTTFGVREDLVYSRFGTYPALLSGDAATAIGASDNTVFDYSKMDHWESQWRYNSGRTTTAGAVLRPFRDIPFVDRLAQSNTGGLGLLGDLLRGLSFTYNRSNNFIPQTPAVDLYLRPLPNVTGNGTDYGFWLNMFGGKVVLHVNRYENNQFNARDGDANTIAQRVLRHDLDAGQSDSFRLYAAVGNWLSATGKPSGKTDILAVMKMDPARYDALVNAYQTGTLAATNDIKGKGTEIEINFNPTNYLTVTASATETEAINSNVSSSIQDYINERMPVWLTLVDPSINDSSVSTNNSPVAAKQEGFPNTLIPANSWWRHSYSTSQTAQQNFFTFVQAPLDVITETQGKPTATLSRYNFRMATNLQLAGLTDRSILKNFSVGGAVRWQGKQSIGYYGQDYANALANGISIYHLDANNPIWEGSQWYFDAFLAYKMRFWHKKIGATFRFNVKNIQEAGGLKPIRAFPDGTPYAYRIVDPRQFIFSSTFDF